MTNEHITIADISQQLAKIKEVNPFIDPEKLPYRLPKIVTKEQDLIELFNLALLNWQTTFKRDEFLTALQTYLKIEPSKRSNHPELIKFFKTVRKAGAILGSAYYFSNQQPKLSDPFVFFLKLLGKINDAYSLTLGNQHAKKLLCFLQNQEFEQLNFEITTTEACQERLISFIDHAQNLLNKKEILVTQYHDLRKKLRHIMNLYQLAAIKNSSNFELQQTFQYLLRLNSKLGKIHDTFVQKELAGKIDYQQEKISIPADLHNELQYFYNLLRNS